MPRPLGGCGQPAGSRRAVTGHHNDLWGLPDRTKWWVRVNGTIQDQNTLITPPRCCIFNGTEIGSDLTLAGSTLDERSREILTRAGGKTTQSLPVRSLNPARQEEQILHFNDFHFLVGSPRTRSPGYPLESSSDQNKEQIKDFKAVNIEHR